MTKMISLDWDQTISFAWDPMRGVGVSVELNSSGITFRLDEFLDSIEQDAYHASLHQLTYPCFLNMRGRTGQTDLTTSRQLARQVVLEVKSHLDL